MNRTWKQIGSLFLSVCMVVTMLPTVAFAETNAKDSGAGLGTSGEITAFTALDEDIAAKTVATGTAEKDLDLPTELAVTVTRTVTTTTGSAVTVTVSGNDTATDSEAQEQQEETQEITEETTVDVSGWTSDPEYNGDAEGDYVFTPALELPDGITLNEGISLPEITITVQEAEEEAPLLFSLLGDEPSTLSTVTPTDETTLANALSSDTASNIVINSSFSLNNSVEVGANHTLSIASGGEIYLLNSCVLTIPAETELTIEGEGSFTCDSNTGIPDGILKVNGSLNLNGIAFNVYSADNIISGTLTATDCDITIEPKAENAYSLWFYPDSEVEINGGTLEIKTPQADSYGICSFTDSPVQISNCTVTMSDSESGSTFLQGDYYFEDSTVVITMDALYAGVLPAGISYSDLTFDNTEVTLDTKTNTTALKGSTEDAALNILNGSEVSVVGTGGTGIFFSVLDNSLTNSVFIDDAVLELQGNGVTGLSLNERTVVSGDNGGRIVFAEGSEVDSMPNTIKDRDVLVTNSGYITVTAASEAADPQKISAGTYIWDGTHFNNIIPTAATFTAEQTGGTSGSVDSTGIVLTFDQSVTDLTADKITVADGTGSVTKGTLSGSGTTWTLALAGVAQEGDVTVSVANFGSYHVTNNPQTVAVYKSAAVPPQLGIPDGLTWDSTAPGKAKWSAVSNSTGYKVQLYKGGTAQGGPVRVTAPATELNFTAAIQAEGAGSYTFAVQAVGNGTTWSDSAWSAPNATAYEYTPGGGSVTGTMDIGGVTGKDPASNQSGTGWTWTANTATLALDSSYGGGPIAINCQSTDTINLVYSGNVSIASTASSALYCKGSLSITGSGGTLTIDSRSQDPWHVAVDVRVLAIGGNAQVNAESANSGTNPYAVVIYGQNGVTVTDSASLTTVATGDDASGIWVERGDITISTTGTVTANGKGTGGGLGIHNGKKLDMSSGSLALTGTPLLGGNFSDYNITGGNITVDGTQVYKAVLTLDDVNAITAIDAITAPASGYGVSSDRTSAGGKLCFLLPAGSQTVTLTAGGKTYTGTVEVATNHTATATLTQQGGTPATNTVTGVTLNKSSVSLYSNTTPNTTTLVATVSPANATNKAVTWQSGNTAVATVDASGKVTAVGNGTAVITVTSADGGHTASCTVTVTTYSSGGNGGGSGSGGGSSSGSTTTPGKAPNQPVTAAAPVTATAGKNGSASASIPEKSVTDAIAKAQADAKAQGKTANGIAVGLDVTMPKGATSLTANLTRNSLNSLVSAGVTSLELNGSPVTVSFDTKALAEIQKQSSGNISITIVPNANLSAAAKAMIGTRPVYDLTVSYVKDGKNTTVTNFGGGTATVSIPYAPAKGEAIGGLYAVYVDGAGNATRIAGSAYDANSGCVMFTTTHFSLYGIGYTAPSAKFTDIANHWAKESIDYVVGRGLLSGTSETTFAPDTAMTRGMLVTALGRLANMDTKVYTTNSFTDVKADSAFRPYIEWAYKNGTVQGIGNGKFEPDRAVTREEIAVIFANYAKATGYTLPVTRNAAAYVDTSAIGSVYKTAVTAMHQAGIMMGGSGNKFNPKQSATRAEVSSLLHRYIKLTIDPATAQGWALNDAGQYLYYKDSKALTGTQTIGGVKYFFNTDGTLKTGWVKDGDNWRYYSGNTMLVGWWDIGANGNNKAYYFAKNGIMVSGKWLQIDGKWYYFNADGSLARSTKIDGYEIDSDGIRKNE